MVGALAAGVPWVSAPAGAQVRPWVTGAVQVTTNPDPARAHVVPYIVRNPFNGTLVIADTENRTKKTVDVYLSTDDGRSWAPGGDPMLKPWTDSSGDPEANINHSLVYDKDGVLLLAFQANDPRFSSLPRADRPRHIFLTRSTDDGRTWERAVKVFDAPESPEAPRSAGKRNNRPWVAVDPNDPQYVYVSWMQWHINDEPTPEGNRALIASSSDGGRTFGQPFSLRAGDPQGSYEARPAVDRHGTVHTIMAGRDFRPPVPAGSPPSQPLIRTVNYRFSTDHGKTWSEARQIEDGNAGFAHNRKWGLRADPNSDTLYAVWYGHPNPRPMLPADERDIYLRVSEDSGKTWSDRILVNVDSAPMVTVHHFDPNISLAPNGRLDVAWFDNRLSPVPAGAATGFQDVWYTYSEDKGRTFAKSIRITDRSINRAFGIWSNNVDVHAPVGLISTDERVYFTWQDSRNGTNDGSAEDTYFASVYINGPPPADEAEARAAADDDGVPRWLLVAAGAAMGMGVAMLVLLATGRRGKPAAAPQPAREPAKI
ncbi:MAG: hypothetical protein ACRD2W_12995 [Acidimicrobiales bacterium]